MEKTTFAVIGGDKRNIYVKELLEADGHFVKAFGFSLIGGDNGKNMAHTLKNCQYIIGPTPFSKDGVFLNTPLSEKQLYSDDFLGLLSEKQTLFAGNVSKESRTLFDRFKIKAYDFLEKKEMAVLNAIPTAEGALAIAINNAAITLHNSNALVIGYGNIGKILSRELQALGAKTCVAARREETRSEVVSNGIRTVSMSNLHTVLHNMDYIFNTVPFVLINKNDISQIQKNALYIELASSPYGIDLNAANEAGLQVISAPSLPGKTAPKTAAKYIVQTIYHIINQEDSSW